MIQTLPPEELEQLSPAELRRHIRELRASQNKLERQNDELRKTQARLEAAQQRYANLYHFAPVGYCTFDQYGTITEANLSAARQLHVELTDLLYTPVYKFIVEEDRDTFYQHLRTVFETYYHQSCEIRLSARNRPFFWARLESLIEPKHNGKKTCLTVITDISEQKQAEQALRESEEKYRTLVNTTSDLIFTVDVQGNLLFANPLAKWFTGDEPEETIGHNFAEYVHPDDVPRLVAALQQALQGEPLGRIKGVVQDAEYRMVKRDGTVIWAATRSLPIKNIRGEIIGFSGIARDITERKQIETALQKSEDRYRLISEMMSDFAYAFCIGQNDAEAHEWMTGAFTRISGYPLDEFEAQEGWLRIVYPDDQDVLQRHRQRVLAGHESVCEYRIVSKDGELFWLRDYSRPIWDEAYRHIVRVIGAVQNITERKNAEEQLRASVQEKEALLKEIHHRVKNNLQVISSLLDFQARYVCNKTPLEVIRESQYRIQAMAMVHEKLYRSSYLARIYADEYLRDLISGLFLSYGAGSVAIIPQIQLDPLELDMDTAVYCGLLINELVSNALKYAFPYGNGGKIGIELRKRSDEQLILTVHDNGVGFPPEFDMENSKSLGLRLVKLFTRQLRGTMTFECNDGTTFVIAFPRRISHR